MPSTGGVMPPLPYRVRVAREHGLAVGFTETSGRSVAGRAWTQQVLARRPVGVIVVYSDHTVEQQEQLAISGIPLVALDPTGQPSHSTPSVGATNWSGGMTATQHLLALVHRPVGGISGPPGDPLAPARVAGVRA